MRATRLVVLLFLIPVLTFLVVLSLPPEAIAAGCCGWEYHWIYFSDASKTTEVGERYSNDVTGESYSVGIQTAYFDFVKRCINPC